MNVVSPRLLPHVQLECCVKFHHIQEFWIWYEPTWVHTQTDWRTNIYNKKTWSNHTTTKRDTPQPWPGACSPKDGTQVKMSSAHQKSGHYVYLWWLSGADAPFFLLPQISLYEWLTLWWFQKSLIVLKLARNELMSNDSNGHYFMYIIVCYLHNSWTCNWLSLDNYNIIMCLHLLVITTIFYQNIQAIVFITNLVFSFYFYIVTFAESF